MKRLLVAATFAAVLTVSACGSSDGGTTTTNGAGGGHPSGGSPASVSNSAPGGGQSDGDGRQLGDDTITIMDYGYSGDLTVEPGEDVTVVNKDSVAHTLTDEATGQFDTGSIAAGGTGSFVAPMQPGKYPFGCTFHPEMSGELTVTD
jgi:plastocyanin